MIPSAFAYERPASLVEALEVLSANQGTAKVVAGGQSLIPLMKLRLAHPERLVDIGRLAELRGVRRGADGSATAGPLTTYADLLADPKLPSILREAISNVADVQVRNRGTIGGSIAHADPGGDLPAVLLALDVSVVLQSVHGQRVVPLDGFFRGPFETDLAPNELLVELRRPALPAGSGAAYRKLAHPASGYAIVGVAAVVARSGGAVSHARVAITGAGNVAYRARSVEAALMGSSGDASTIAAAAAHAVDGVTVASDFHADSAYRSEMAKVLTRRAVESAMAAAG